MVRLYEQWESQDLVWRVEDGLDRFTTWLAWRGFTDLGLVARNLHIATADNSVSFHGLAHPSGGSILWGLPRQPCYHVTNSPRMAV